MIVEYDDRNPKVQSGSDFMPAHASPSGFAAPFSISPTCGFAFGTYFNVEYTPKG